MSAHYMTAKKLEILQNCFDPTPNEAFIEEDFQASLTGPKNHKSLHIYTRDQKWLGRKTYLMPVSGNTYRLYWVDASSPLSGYVFGPYAATPGLIRNSLSLSTQTHLRFQKRHTIRAVEVKGKVYEKTRCIDITFPDEFFSESRAAAANPETTTQSRRISKRTGKLVRKYKSRGGSTAEQHDKGNQLHRAAGWDADGADGKANKGTRGKGSDARCGSTGDQGNVDMFLTHLPSKSNSGSVGGYAEVTSLMREYLNEAFIYPIIEKMNDDAQAPENIAKLKIVREVGQGFSAWLTERK